MGPCLWNKCQNFDQQHKERKDICNNCDRFNLGAKQDLAKRLPPTSADRIRAMSNEELAEYLVNHRRFDYPNSCLEWLESEVTE